GAWGGGVGAFGLGALAVELPISTTIMLRSIADIARSEGEDLRHIDARLSCIQVFALGGATESDDAMESSYWASRAAMGKLVTEAARHVAEKGVSKAGAPPLVRLVSAVAARFQIPLTQKVAAQAIPLVGAVGGAGINLLFIDHFQDMARGHYTVRRFERTHGIEETRAQYGIILARMKNK
ncbi:MAG: EcsC family protein, partial [Candidatus Sumerlaeia bacterium]|nr:EcsC family protein [Candidatus Sumerlaeia bacterium]